MQPDTEQLMKKLHASLCPDKLEAEIRDKFLALEAEIERLKDGAHQDGLLRVRYAAERDAAINAKDFK